MKAKSLIPLLVAAVLGLGAFIVGKDMFKPQGPGQANMELSPVVVFAKDLEPGAMLQQDDLTVAQMPPAAALKGTISIPNQAIGRVLTARVVKGQMLLNGMMAPVGTGSGLQALVPKGMRAVSLSINEVSGLSGLLVPGCRVDVVCIMEDQKTSQTFARTVVEGVMVSAVGQILSAGGGAKADGTREEAKSATLLVTPSQAEAISLASTQGVTRLVLRSGDDDSTHDSKGITLRQLTGRPDEPEKSPIIEVAPATQPVVVLPPEVPHRTVQIIRGGNEGRVNFELSGEPMPDNGAPKAAPKSDVFSSN